MDIKSYSLIFAISLVVLVAAWLNFSDAEENVRMNMQRIGRKKKIRKQNIWIGVVMVAIPMVMASFIEMVLRIKF